MAVPRLFSSNIMTNIKKIGFACKLIDHPDQVNGIKPKDDCAKYNTGTTTVAWLNRQSRTVAEQKLWDIMKDNIEATTKLVRKVGTFNEHLRMVRLSSDILPVYTHPEWSYFYRQQDVIRYMERYFATIGEVARANNVRVSCHPGQFVVLASDDPSIVENSIAEFEYHADMIRMMGYGKQFQDFKCNVHISGRLGPDGIRAAYTRLSPEARNTITIENEENSWGIDDCLQLADLCPIVLDIHHHFCREGEYIEITDPRVQMVIDSWRGVRPVLHYSQSREEYLAGYSRNERPSRHALMESGVGKQKLRAHSDFFYNTEINRWAGTFWDYFDVMCESKAKNLASERLFKEWLV
jgi:UV damage endonuclease UvdE